MVHYIVKVKLNLFLKKEVARTLLSEIRTQIIQENMYEELEVSDLFGHSLSNVQMVKLDNRISNSKKTLTVGQFLRKITSEKGSCSYNEKKFSVAQITKTYWSRLINDKYNVYDKDKLIRISFLYKLSLKETMELLNKAGFILSEDNTKDEVIAFCLEEGIYNLNDVDELLENHNLPTLFSNIR